MQTTQTKWCGGERETSCGRAGEDLVVVGEDVLEASITGSKSQDVSRSPLPFELKAWIDNVILSILKREMMNL
jgi:hypothetical protein